MKFNKSSLFKSTGITGMVVTPTGLYIDSLLHGKSQEQLLESRLAAKDLELQNKDLEIKVKDQELIDQKFVYRHDLKNKERTIRSLSGKPSDQSVELQNAKQLIEELTTERNQADATRNKLLKDIEDLKTKSSEEKDDLLDEIADLQDQIESKNKAIKVSLQGIADREKLIALLKQQVIDRKEADDILFDYMYEVISRHNKRVDSDEQNFDELYTVITDMADEISELNVKLDKEQTVKQELEASVRANVADFQNGNRSNTELEELREQLVGIMETNTVLKSQLDAYKVLNEQLKGTVRETMGEETRSKQELDGIKDTILEQQAKINWYEEKSDKDAAEINKLKGEVADRESQVTTYETLIFKFGEEQKKLNEKLKELQSRLHGLEGFQHTANTYTPYNTDLCKPDSSDPTTYICKGLFFNRKENDGSNSGEFGIKKIINESLDS